MHMRTVTAGTRPPWCNMLPEFTREELAAGLDAVAAEILAQAGVDGPPVDAFAVAGRLGLTVALDDRQQGRARYVRLSGGRPGRTRPTILLRPEVRRERQHWAVAHEIGEHGASRVCRVAPIRAPRPPTPAKRRPIIWPAACCCPRRGSPPTGRSAAAIFRALKQRYATASHELIARRMLECRPPVVITIFDERQVYFRGGNLPGCLPPLSPPEAACWRRVHEHNEPHAARDDLRSVQGWPVHEEGWQREILRAGIRVV